MIVFLIEVFLEVWWDLLGVRGKFNFVYLDVVLIGWVKMLNKKREFCGFFLGDGNIGCC